MGGHQQWVQYRWSKCPRVAKQHERFWSRDPSGEWKLLPELHQRLRTLCIPWFGRQLRVGRWLRSVYFFDDCRPIVCRSLHPRQERYCCYRVTLAAVLAIHSNCMGSWNSFSSSLFLPLAHFVIRKDGHDKVRHSPISDRLFLDLLAAHCVRASELGRDGSHSGN